MKSTWFTTKTLELFCVISVHIIKINRIEKTVVLDAMLQDM